jgi:hypothetical protein
LDTFKQTINSILALLLQLGDLIVAGIVAIEIWLREQLGHFGLPPGVQTTILLALAALLIVASLKLFGGLIRIAFILVLLLVAIHIMMPVLQH